MRRVWRFAECEFSEWERRLWVRGESVTLQPRPLEVLLVLLQAENHALTRDQILGQVWGGDADDNSLRVAVNRLRAVLGRPDIIELVHRVGYKIAVPVQERLFPDGPSSDDGPSSGKRVPGCDDWLLEEALDTRNPHRVWLARHTTTKEAEVFKFAKDDEGLRALQREKTVYRALRRFPDARYFVEVLNWRFTSKPYFLQMEYGGLNLAEWAEKQRAEGGLARETCLTLVADLAEALAAAHEIGILHNDLKPSNILVSPSPGQPGHWQVKIADFGIAQLSDPGRITALDITVQGFANSSDDGLTGTALYLAPEVGPGRQPTTKADIYALGIVLFQLLCGDFREVPSPGWEARVNDPLLEQDISRAANLNPARRFDSAAELAKQLRTLPERRAELQREEAERLESQQQLEAAHRSNEEKQRQLDRRNARRPWIAAALLFLALGLCTSLWFFYNARQQQAITARVNDFLNNDVLEQANPASGNAADRTLHDAVLEASGGIDREFAREPAIAARLHETVAKALNGLSDYASAGREYDHAAARWTEAEGPLTQEAMSAQFEHANMDARSYEPGSIDRARTLFSQEETLYRQLSKPSTLVRISELSSRGTIALAEAKTKQALEDYQLASHLADSDPAVPSRRRLVLQQRLCVMKLKAGEAPEAEACDRELIARLHHEFGPNANDELPEIALTQTLLGQGKNQEAIQETTRIYPRVAASLGPENNLTLQVLATRAAAEGTLGMWAPAISDDLLVSEAAHKHYPHGLMAIGSLSDAALSECRNRQIATGEKHARQAFADAHFTGISSGVLGATAYTVVTCILADWQGSVSPARLDEADHLLGNIDTPAVAAITANPAWGANVVLSQAIIAAKRGQFAQSSALLAKAQPSFTGPTADPYPKLQCEMLAAFLAKQGHVRKN